MTFPPSPEGGNSVKAAAISIEKRKEEEP